MAIEDPEAEWQRKEVAEDLETPETALVPPGPLSVVAG